MNQRVPVSIVVPIKNESENLERCLSGVSWADEIFVVDSQSTDRSAEIAAKHGGSSRAISVQWHLAEKEELGP